MGSRYTDTWFTEHLELVDIQPSIGSVGHSDNCLAEYFNVSRGNTRPVFVGGMDHPSVRETTRLRASW